jgi:hypothetical protein
MQPHITLRTLWASSDPWPSELKLSNLKTYKKTVTSGPRFFMFGKLLDNISLRYLLTLPLVHLPSSNLTDLVSSRFLINSWSWETTITIPLKVLIIFSNCLVVAMSTWLVGSSKIRTLLRCNERRAKIILDLIHGLITSIFLSISPLVNHTLARTRLTSSSR